MSELLVTQCPHCQTRFRLTPEQLSVANGHVRCGACLEVFHAADAAASLSQPAASPEPRPMPPDQSSLLHDDLDDADEPDLAALGLDESIISEVNPGGVADSAAIEGHAPPLADLHEDFIATPPAQDFGPDFDHNRSGLYRRLPEDEGYTDKGIFQRDHPGAGSRLSPPGHRDKPAEELTPEPPTQSASDDHGADTAPGSPLADSLSSPPSSPAPSTSSPGPALSPTPAAPSATPASSSLPPPSSFPRTRESTGVAEPALGENDRPEPPITPLRLEMLEEELLNETPVRRRPPSWLWGTLALLALLALPAQYLYYNFAALAHDQRSRPLLENLCLVARCELPARVDISRIRSTNLLVRPHPEFPNALAIDVILYNRADFEQPFPVLEMEFTDTSGRRLASRRFRPEEYLSGELAGVRLMPPQTPIHVGLSMLDPGPQARNYRLDFLSP